jgi:hypothetical protein
MISEKSELEGEAVRSHSQEKVHNLSFFPPHLMHYIKRK